MISIKRGLPLNISVAIYGLLLPAVFPQGIFNVNDIPGAIRFSTDDSSSDVPYYSLIKDNDDGTLYLGSSGYVYKVNSANFHQIWAHNITKVVGKEIITCEATTPDDQEKYWCANQISVIEEIEGENQLLICGTNSGRPRCWNCTMADGSDERLSCDIYTSGRTDRYFPSRPDFDSTWLYVPHTGLVYVGTEREASKESFIAKVAFDELFTQNPTSLLTNNPSNENWLNMPAFVGEPVLRGNYVYFFFRETATEYKNAGKIIYSRVGRICANNSKASPTFIAGYYQTLVKARLNCSIDLDFPFYFNEIQDVYMSEDIIYAVFTTPREGPPASAVCAFSWLEIEDLFDIRARYKGQESSDADWLPKTYGNLGLTERPGTCDVLFNSDAAKKAINDYNLIDQLVPSTRDVISSSSDSSRSSASPLLYYNNYRFNSIVKVENENEEEIVLMIGTNDNKVLKAYFKTSMGAEEYGTIVSKIELGGGEHEVRDMITYKENNETFVIATAVNDAFKIPVVYCGVYKTCEECTHAQDPDCVWLGGACAKRNDSDQEHERCYITSKSKVIDFVQALGGTQHVSTRTGHAVNFYAFAIAKKGCNFQFSLQNDTGYWVIKQDGGTATDAEFFAVRFTGTAEYYDQAENVAFNLSCSNNKDSMASMTAQVVLDKSGELDCAEDIYRYDCELARYEYQLSTIRQKILEKCHENTISENIYQCPSFSFQDPWRQV